MTTRRLLMAAAMAGLAVSIYSQASWYGLWLGSVLAGLALALAIDCGIFAAMRAAFDGDDRALWVVAGLAIVSWLANAQHAAMIHAGGALDLEGWAALDPLTGGNAVLTAGIAPIAAVALAWLGHRAGKREAGHSDAAAYGPDPDLFAAWGGNEWPVALDPVPAAPVVDGPSMTATPAARPVTTPAGGKLEQDARVAELAGVKPRTARQWRTVGDARYGQALASANGNGAG